MLWDILILKDSMVDGSPSSSWSRRTVLFLPIGRLGAGDGPGGAPPPAPHAPRRAHAHLPCPSRAPPRAILCPIASQLTACVCPELCRSRRELSNEVLYVYWGRVFCLELRSKSQNFLPGLRPGPRIEHPSLDAPPRRSGGLVAAQRGGVLACQT